MMKEDSVGCTTIDKDILEVVKFTETKICHKAWGEIQCNNDDHKVTRKFIQKTTTNIEILNTLKFLKQIVHHCATIVMQNNKKNQQILQGILNKSLILMLGFQSYQLFLLIRPYH